MKCKSTLAGLVVSALLVPSFIHAQSQVVAGGILGIGIPFGDFRTTQTISIGFNFLGGYSFFQEKMQAVINVGYMHFFGEKSDDNPGNTIRTNVILGWKKRSNYQDCGIKVNLTSIY